MEWLEFGLLIGKLKRLKRTGWVREGVNDPESVAEHSFRTAVLAMFLAHEFAVDQSRVIKMALIHDIGEAVIGDIVTQRGADYLLTQQEKLHAERHAIEQISVETGVTDFIELFDEFSAGITKEAQLVIQLDKIEMAIQAYEYEQEQGLSLPEFFVNAAKHAHDQKLVDFLTKLERGR